MTALTHHALRTFLSLVAVMLIGSVALAEEENTNRNLHGPTTVEEARGRAKILHETLHGTLQVMHRDFYREDEGLPIPSHSLEDVFAELNRSYQVKLRWIAVDAVAMNVANKPKTEFERNAAKAIAAGEKEYEATKDQIYWHAGRIRLASQCLKCHAPTRTSTDDRSAALIISMQLKSSP